MCLWTHCLGWGSEQQSSWWLAWQGRPIRHKRKIQFQNLSVWWHAEDSVRDFCLWNWALNPDLLHTDRSFVLRSQNLSSHPKQDDKNSPISEVFSPVNHLYYQKHTLVTSLEWRRRAEVHLLFRNVIFMDPEWKRTRNYDAIFSDYSINCLRACGAVQT